MEPIKKTVRVTIEKEIEIELMPSMFIGMSKEEFIAEWKKGLFPVEGMDDIIEHAAAMAAEYGSGYELDGLGLIGYDHMTNPRIPDVKFREIYSDIETEILP